MSALEATDRGNFALTSSGKAAVMNYLTTDRQVKIVGKFATRANS